MFVLAQTLCRMSFLSRFVTGTDEIYILFLRCNTAAVCSEFQQLIFFFFRYKCTYTRKNKNMFTEAFSSQVALLFMLMSCFYFQLLLVCTIT